MATFTKRGDGQWQAKVRRKGWPQQSATFPTKKRAQDWASGVESEMASGRFVDRSPAQRATLKDLIEVYLTEVTDKRRSDNARASECSRLERFVREETELCAHAAANLTPEHFEDYRDRRLKTRYGKNKDKTIKPASVRRELSQLKKVIDHRKRRLGLTINPVNTDDVKRPAVNDARDVRLTKAEQDKLLQACSEARNPWLRPVVELAFETGGRRGSLLELTWSDVDLNARQVIFRDVKNSAKPDEIIDHVMPLSPRAIEILQELPRSLDGRVFPLTANALRQAFNRARTKAGVEHFRFHDTRHEMVSSLFEAGLSDVTVMSITGHRDPKSVKRYANLKTSHLADELARIKAK